MCLGPPPPQGATGNSEMLGILTHVITVCSISVLSVV